MRWVDEAFSKLDVNGDGFISMDEIMDKLPLETTDPDDDQESERFLQVRRADSMQCYLGPCVGLGLAHAIKAALYLLQWGCVW